MDKKVAPQSENRNELRAPGEPGMTVIVHSGDCEILGTIDNKSDNGVGVSIPQSYQHALPQNADISLTYNTPYGLISRQAQVCWSRSDDNGLLKVGASVVDSDKPGQDNYQQLWKDFVDAEQLDDAAGYWLSLQAAMISGVTRAVIVLAKGKGAPMTPVSFWPEGQRGTLGLTEAAELALQERRTVLRDTGQRQQQLNFRAAYIGYPLVLNEEVFGVVALEIALRPEPMMRAVVRQLQWGAAWLELMVRRSEGLKYTPENQQLVTVLALIVASLEHEQFQSAATRVVTELATLLGCERVSLGFLRGKYAQLQALSHSADFARKSQLAQSIGMAMDEAIDQLQSLVCPPLIDSSVQVLRCHEKLMREQGTGSICTVPMSVHGKVIGALTLERAAGLSFDKKTLELCETVASLVGPILDSKWREDRWLPVKAWWAVKAFLRRVFGPAHAGLKLTSAALIAAVLFFTFASGDYRVTAETYLEGKIQRTIVTPFDGYIKEAYARAGDQVTENMALAELDDSDLLLEQTKWRSQRQQFLKEYRDAMGKGERSKVTVLQSQLKQVEAQLEMIAAQLSRIRVKAPFDGIVVSGDLSQALGSPTQRGDVLFEIAPLNDYRVILEVDERDIRELTVEQSGEMVLAGRSDTVIPFRVTHITPVSESKEGRTYFRVEAALSKQVDFLRPGMKGVGKITIGERKLIWVWTRPLLDWLRLNLWTWWPEGL